MSADPARSPEILPLPDETFRLLGDLLRERSGLRLAASDRRVVQGRLAARLRALGLRDFFRYYFHLRYDPGGDDELARIFDLVAVQETYFFRHPAQMRVLEREILPELARAGAVRAWCAGCSTGEEAYTLAWLARGLPRLRILATDLSPGALEQARRGVYSRGSFRGEDLPRSFVDAFPVVVDGLSRRVPETLRSAVRFEQDNLLGPDRDPAAHDLVLCRNVLTHLHAEVHGRVLARLTRALRPGGYLLLGPHEAPASLPPGLELAALRHDLAYRRTAT